MKAIISVYITILRNAGDLVIPGTFEGGLLLRMLLKTEEFIVSFYKDYDQTQTKRRQPLIIIVKGFPVTGDHSVQVSAGTKTIPINGCLQR